LARSFTVQFSKIKIADKLFFSACQQAITSLSHFGFRVNLFFLLVSDEAMLQSVYWSNEEVDYRNEGAMSINYLTLMFS